MAKNKIRAYLYDNALTTDDLHDFIARAEIMKSPTSGKPARPLIGGTSP